MLPDARELAGTSGNGSGPNCLGTVMAAAGVRGAADEWMQQAPLARRRTEVSPWGAFGKQGGKGVAQAAQDGVAFVDGDD